jgi:hypothetical protein
MEEKPKTHPQKTRMGHPEEEKEKAGKSSPQRAQRAQRNKDSNLEIRILGKPKTHPQKTRMGHPEEWCLPKLRE